MGGPTRFPNYETCFCQNWDWEKLGKIGKNKIALKRFITLLEYIYITDHTHLECLRFRGGVVALERKFPEYPGPVILAGTFGVMDPNT